MRAGCEGERERETERVGMRETERVGMRETERVGMRETERVGMRETERVGMRACAPSFSLASHCHVYIAHELIPTISRSRIGI